MVSEALILAALKGTPSIISLIMRAQTEKAMTDEEFIAGMYRRQVAMQKKLAEDIGRRSAKRKARRS